LHLAVAFVDCPGPGRHPRYLETVKAGIAVMPFVDGIAEDRLAITVGRPGVELAGAPYAQLQLVKFLALIIQLVMVSSSPWLQGSAVEALSNSRSDVRWRRQGYHNSNLSAARNEESSTGGSSDYKMRPVRGLGPLTIAALC
jgi:hypothetical protein